MTDNTPSPKACKKFEDFYCPFCKRVIKPDQYGFYLHDLVEHPRDFNPADYRVMH